MQRSSVLFLALLTVATGQLFIQFDNRDAAYQRGATATVSILTNLVLDYNRCPLRLSFSPPTLPDISYTGSPVSFSVGNRPLFYEVLVNDLNNCYSNFLEGPLTSRFWVLSDGRPNPIYGASLTASNSSVPVATPISFTLLTDEPLATSCAPVGFYQLSTDASVNASVKITVGSRITPLSFQPDIGGTWTLTITSPCFPAPLSTSFNVLKSVDLTVNANVYPDVYITVNTKSAAALPPNCLVRYDLTFSNGSIIQTADLTNTSSWIFSFDPNPSTGYGVYTINPTCGCGYTCNRAQFTYGPSPLRPVSLSISPNYLFSLFYSYSYNDCPTTLVITYGNTVVYNQTASSPGALAFSPSSVGNYALSLKTCSNYNATAIDGKILVVGQIPVAMTPNYNGTTFVLPVNTGMVFPIIPAEKSFLTDGCYLTVSVKSPGFSASFPLDQNHTVYDFTSCAYPGPFYRSLSVGVYGCQETCYRDANCVAYSVDTDNNECFLQNFASNFSNSETFLCGVTPSNKPIYLPTGDYTTSWTSSCPRYDPTPLNSFIFSVVNPTTTIDSVRYDGNPGFRTLKLLGFDTSSNDPCQLNVLLYLDNVLVSNLTAGLDSSLPLPNVGPSGKYQVKLQPFSGCYNQDLTLKGDPRASFTIPPVTPTLLPFYPIYSGDSISPSWKVFPPIDATTLYYSLSNASGILINDTYNPMQEQVSPGVYTYQVSCYTPGMAFTTSSPITILGRPAASALYENDGPSLQITYGTPFLRTHYVRDTPLCPTTTVTGYNLATGNVVSDFQIVYDSQSATITAPSTLPVGNYGYKLQGNETSCDPKAHYTFQVIPIVVQPFSYEHLLSTLDYFSLSVTNNPGFIPQGVNLTVDVYPLGKKVSAATLTFNSETNLVDLTENLKEGSYQLDLSSNLPVFDFSAASGMLFTVYSDATKLPCTLYDTFSANNLVISLSFAPQFYPSPPPMCNVTVQLQSKAHRFSITSSISDNRIYLPIPSSTPYGIYNATWSSDCSGMDLSQLSPQYDWSDLYRDLFYYYTNFIQYDGPQFNSACNLTLTFNGSTPLTLPVHSAPRSDMRTLLLPGLYNIDCSSSCAIINTTSFCGGPISLTVENLFSGSGSWKSQTRISPSNVAASSCTYNFTLYAPAASPIVFTTTSLKPTLVLHRDVGYYRYVPSSNYQCGYYVNSFSYFVAPSTTYLQYDASIGQFGLVNSLTYVDDIIVTLSDIIHPSTTFTTSKATNWSTAAVPSGVYRASAVSYANGPISLYNSIVTVGKPYLLRNLAAVQANLTSTRYHKVGECISLDLGPYVQYWSPSIYQTPQWSSIGTDNQGQYQLCLSSPYAGSDATLNINNDIYVLAPDVNILAEPLNGNYFIYAYRSGSMVVTYMNVYTNFGPWNITLDGHNYNHIGDYTQYNLWRLPNGPISYTINTPLGSYPGTFSISYQGQRATLLSRTDSQLAFDLAFNGPERFVLPAGTTVTMVSGNTAVSANVTSQGTVTFPYVGPVPIQVDFIKVDPDVAKLGWPSYFTQYYSVPTYTTYAARSSQAIVGGYYPLYQQTMAVINNAQIVGADLGNGDKRSLSDVSTFTSTNVALTTPNGPQTVGLDPLNSLFVGPLAQGDYSANFGPSSLSWSAYSLRVDPSSVTISTAVDSSLNIAVNFTVKDVDGKPLSPVMLARFYLQTSIVPPQEDREAIISTAITPGNIVWVVPHTYNNFTVTVLATGITYYAQFPYPVTIYNDVVKSPFSGNTVTPKILGIASACTDLQVYIPGYATFSISSSPRLPWNFTNGIATVPREYLEHGKYIISAGGSFGLGQITVTIGSINVDIYPQVYNLRPSDKTIFTPTWASCKPAGVTYMWYLNEVNTYNGSTFTVAPFSFPLGRSYLYLMVMKGNQYISGAETSFRISAAAPTFSLTSGIDNFQVSAAQAFKLNASASTDVDAPSGSVINAAWSCSSNGSPCLDSQGKNLSLASQLSVTVPANTLSVGIYNFQVQLTSNFTGLYTIGNVRVQVLSADGGLVPQFSITSHSDLRYVDGTYATTLQASLDKSQTGQFSAFSYAWSCDHLTLDTINTNGLSSSTLTVRAGVLSDCRTYTFTLAAKAANSARSLTNVTVSTTCPLQGNLYASRTTGSFVVDTFIFTPQFQTAGNPKFSYYYQPLNGTLVFVDTLSTPLSIRLPPLSSHTVTFIVNVLDDTNSRGNASVTINLTNYNSTSAADTAALLLFNTDGSVTLGSINSALSALNGSTLSAADANSLSGHILDGITSSLSGQTQSETQASSTVLALTSTLDIVQKSTTVSKTFLSKLLSVFLSSASSLELQPGQTLSASYAKNNLLFITKLSRSSKASGKRQEGQEFAFQLVSAVRSLAQATLVNRGCGETAQSADSDDFSIYTVTSLGSTVGSLKTNATHGYASLPSDILTTSGAAETDCFSVVYVRYASDLANSAAPAGLSPLNTAAPVISLEVTPGTYSTSGPSTFSIGIPYDGSSPVACAHRKDINSTWISDNTCTVSVSNGVATCSCSHLTEFTVFGNNTNNNTNTNSSQSESSPSSGLSAGAKAGIAIGVIAFVALVAGIIAFVLIKKKQQRVSDGSNSIELSTKKDTPPAYSSQQP
ncbi:hemagluttinin domain-containing protein [Planoprotostelium fungivorum]|uniref:Hemagluttinin domain-containing protein n=1 Tax=Planoprotostelium fungivorum TaxID=1890364 RepID=A0A2P6NMP2_9EUKA|nr:hemagluttinin domain-containing protein [Planoprotostelium fungivorum]